MKTDVSVGSVNAARPSVLPNLDAPKKSGVLKDGSSEFNALLSSRLGAEVPEENGLQFSSHAIKRMAERNIELSATDMEKIKEALAKVGEKGARESLILSSKGAFIVNVKEKKVITAIDPESARDSTFTNIDSTVLI